MMSSTFLLSIVLCDICRHGSVMKIGETIQFFYPDGVCAFIIACGDWNGAMVVERCMAECSWSEDRARLQDVASSIRDGQAYGIVGVM